MATPNFSMVLLMYSMNFILKLVIHVNPMALFLFLLTEEFSTKAIDVEVSDYHSNLN